MASKPGIFQASSPIVPHSEKTRVPAGLLPPVSSDEDALARNFDNLRSAASEAGIGVDWMDLPEARKALSGILGNSPFLSDCVVKEPALTKALLEGDPASQVGTVLAKTRALAEQRPDERSLMRDLRVHKRQMALSIAWADMFCNWPVMKVTGALSDFADASLSAAMAFSLRQTAARGAIILDDMEMPERGCGFFVLAMGKQGAKELNYSSDIDLVCLFDPERVRTEKPDDLQKHAIRLTRNVARILDERTTDGYVFRVDLRLRPDPASTPLALSTLAAEAYYESVGQNWERAAMIKARVAAGDTDAGNVFLTSLRPFVWRKSLDFAAIQDIHSIKRQIHAHKGGGEIAVLGHNIKTGRGGIREVEFFVQTQQLIWGGRDPALRSSRTLDALDSLTDAGQVDPLTRDEMVAGYTFLRNVEHRLQMERDEQTQVLPDTPEKLDRFARFCGYPSGDAFRADLVEVLTTVSSHYGDLFEDAPSLTSDFADGNLSFTGVEADPETLTTLSNMGFKNPGTIDQSIRSWHHARIRATRSDRARQILTELTPTLISAIAAQPDPDATFLRLDAFLTALPAGVQLFSMFQTHPELLNLIAEVMGQAPRLAEELGRRPHLLDNLLDPDLDGTNVPLGELVVDCEKALTDCLFYEDVLDAVRRWNGDQRFICGIQLLNGGIDGVHASQRYSDIAEAVLSVLLPRVIAEFATSHGEIKDGAFAVVALGKLGTRELTATSDLDLIFVYNAPDLDQDSSGPRALPVPKYYARLGQRVITAVSSLTAEGVLYDLDMRLRPSGNKGPVASSLEAFDRYYREDAWTWEHQALVRARVIFSTGDLGARANEIIRDTLCQRRDHLSLARDVSSMRARIAATHKTKSIWSLKHADGGQIDVDFLWQYFVLVLKADHPDLRRSDPSAVFNTAAAEKYLSDEQAEVLASAKKLYQTLQTYLSLVFSTDISDDTAISERQRQAIARLMTTPNFADASRQLMDIQRRVRHIFETTLMKSNGEQ